MYNPSFGSRLSALSFGVIIMVTSSCHKENHAVENECINRIVPRISDYKVSGADLDSVNALFNRNRLSVTNLQFQTLSLANIGSPDYSGPEQQVLAFQFFNGLPLFDTDDFFTFYNGIYQPALNTGYAGSAPGGDTSGHQALTDLRTDFLNHVSEAIVDGGPAGGQSHFPDSSLYSSTCLSVTLGYLQTNLIPPYSYSSNATLVKVWLVSPFNNTYPTVYVEDDNGFSWGKKVYVPLPEL